MNENAVDAKTVAAYLGISLDTVYSHAQSESIPAFKVGNRWRFFISEIDAHRRKPQEMWAQSAQSLGRRRAK